MPNLDITAEIEAIKKAFEGRQVRQSIVDALTAVQEKLNEYAPAELIHGSTTIIAEGDNATAAAIVDLPFEPTENTKIIGSVRVKHSPMPYFNQVLTFCLFSTGGSKLQMYATLCNGANKSGPDTVAVPAGTYIVDWVVLDKGETATVEETQE